MQRKKISQSLSLQWTTIMILYIESFSTLHQIFSFKMQAAVFSVSQPLPVLLPAKTLGSPWNPAPRLAASPRLPRLRAMTVPPDSSSTVDYSSVTSVFPAEACETIGGEACSVNMYPEVKLSPDEDKKNPPRSASEDIDREYYDYNSPKTVFLEEACDDLGGEFCGTEYQKGV
ncbi:hypothetical protein SAY87_024329 [Trapa incisa]|uniref:Light-regulated protein n=1 Tax=Trapa incisa TaxID=236973 RepID=A0AAN7G9K0_9MYRT|nr:hypothetical protein SAY87_024329 [Trapa incisa]